MSIGSVVLIVGAIVAAVASIAMLRAVSRPAVVPQRRARRLPTAELVSFEDALELVVTETRDAALRFVLRARLEAARGAPAGARRLQLLAILHDLEHHDLGRPSEVALTTLDEPLAVVSPEHRDGLAARELWAEVGGLTEELSGSSRVIGASPVTGDSEKAWSAAVSSGEFKRAMAALQERLAARFGDGAARDLIERGCRAIGARFPLSCLPGLLATIDDSLLVADRAFAQERAQMWEDFLATRRSLGKARMHLAQSDLQKWASVGRLAAGVAHEINNPLSYAVGSAQSLRTELDELNFLENPDHRELIDDLEHGLERIRDIVRDLQVFSRGGNEDRRSDVNLDELIGSMVRIAGPEIQGKAEVSLELGAPPPIFGDEGKLGQIIVNLVVNAAQACDGEGTISVRTGVADGGCFVEVADDGPGISDSVKELIFDPFFTTKEVGEGTGLGLAISREIAERHGGYLDVESSEGEGARFRLWLPLESTMARAPRPSRPPPVREGEEIRGLRVLVVDDEPGMRRIMRRYLGRRHEVVVADSGERALELLANDRDFDVILLDISMPGMGGRAAFEALSTVAPELPERVLFLSGGATDSETASFLDRHSSRSLAKPISPKELEAIIVRRFARAS